MDNEPKFFEETPWFWVLFAVCCGIALYIPLEMAGVFK